MSKETQQVEINQGNALQGTALEEAFLDAVNKAQSSTPSGSKAVSNEIKLQLYALYKQATQNDAHGPKPAFLDMVGRAKYKAWESLKGMESSEAKAQYVAVFQSVNSL